MKIRKWLDERYKILWESFLGNSFGFDEAVQVLRDKIHDPPEQVNVILSELRKAGLLNVQFHPKDARKRIYMLKSKTEMISETLTIEKEHLTRSDLETLLKKAADLIRTRVDYTFILVLLFFKRLSDKWEIEFDNAYSEALRDGFRNEEAKKEAKSSMYHDFDILEDYLWENLRKDPARLPENFSMAMKTLAEQNPELRDVFENVDFVQFTNNRENVEILRQLVELFSARPLHHVSSDILGDAYEWILRYFAPQKAKEGEVYTPREVINLLVRILGPKPGESVYDPASGSAGMLILSYQHLDRKDANRLFLFGQEANYKTLALAKMNLYIHDIRNAQLLLGDTLLYPKFKEGERLKKFDIVIANPPWNQDGYYEEVLKKGEFWRERFKYGFTTKQSADWAWVQHMLSSANDEKGRVGIVIDNGCLFRGGREKATRMGVIKDDLLDAVILLPEKLFYNTGAPGAVLIFNKNKIESNKGKVLFINASKEYEQHPEVRKLNRLGTENQNKIVTAYKEFKEIKGFSRIVDIGEIEKNDFNLNVTLYVFPEEEIEQIDIAKEWDGLKDLDKKISEISNKIASYLEELEGVNKNV
ncbi:MAG: class I SAM-dependent DNA methyltransferase [candidate division WOR-3 bacterium]|nr:class I SAM-dependent DNA methyltransferase [candidate division WOR-3 bacterium]